MKRRVTINLSEESAFLLMDFLGMHSEVAVINLWKDVKNSCPVSISDNFDEDYPRYDPKKAFNLIDKIYSKLSNELKPTSDITITI